MCMLSSVGYTHCQLVIDYSPSASSSFCFAPAHTWHKAVHKTAKNAVNMPKVLLDTCSSDTVARMMPNNNRATAKSLCLPMVVLYARYSMSTTAGVTQILDIW